ncbi:hypothetical protein CRYUN_Cryun18bG0022800 [Craigia yunnanensis]
MQEGSLRCDVNVSIRPIGQLEFGTKIVDPVEIGKMLDSVLSENLKQLEQYRAGKTKLQGFFACQVMKLSKGKANPGLFNKILLEKLNAKT